MDARVPVLAIVVQLLTVGAATAGHFYTLDPAIQPRRQPPAGTAHLSDASARVMVPQDVLSHDYLFWSVVEASTDNILNLGTSTKPILVRFQLHDGLLDMVADNRAIYGDAPGAPVSIVNRFPARTLPEGIEVDLSGAARVGLGSTSLTSTAASQVSGFRADAHGITWAQVLLMQSDNATIDNPGPLTIAFRYWLLPAPDAGYTARSYPADDQSRVGFFKTTAKARDAGGLTQTQAVVNRWDPRGQVTVLIHPTVPASMRPAVKQAVLSWNSAFRKVLNKDFVQVEEGTDPAVLPGTPGKIVLYWYDYDVPSTRGILAIGPSLADPRTGELVSGYVLFYGARVRRLIEQFKSDARFVAEDLPPATPPPGHAFRLSLPGGGALDFALPDGYPADPLAALDARAMADASGMTDEQVMARLAGEMLPHEVGHTLGLRHNFKGTADLTHLRAGETATTVMDYPIYLSALTGPGPYDEAAIAYGYGTADAGVMKDMWYGSDEVKDVDPDANTFDSGEPLAFYEARMGYYHKLLASPDTFPKPEDYLAAVTATLTHVRRCVNEDPPDRSAKALAFLASVAMAADPPPAPPSSGAPPAPPAGPPRSRPRASSMDAPASDPVALVGSSSPPPPGGIPGPLAALAATYRVLERRVALDLLSTSGASGAKDFSRLTRDQVASVAQLAGSLLAASGPQPMAVRQGALAALVALKDIRAYQVLESIDKAMGQAASTPATSDADLAMRALAIAVHKAVETYF